MWKVTSALPILVTLCTIRSTFSNTIPTLTWTNADQNSAGSNTHQHSAENKADDGENYMFSIVVTGKRKPTMNANLQDEVERMLSIGERGAKCGIDNCGQDWDDASRQRNCDQREASCVHNNGLLNNRDQQNGLLNNGDRQNDHLNNGDRQNDHLNNRDRQNDQLNNRDRQNDQLNSRDRQNDQLNNRDRQNDQLNNRDRQNDHLNNRDRHNDHLNNREDGSVQLNGRDLGTNGGNHQNVQLNSHGLETDGRGRQHVHLNGHDLDTDGRDRQNDQLNGRDHQNDQLNGRDLGTDGRDHENSQLNGREVEPIQRVDKAADCSGSDDSQRSDCQSLGTQHQVTEATDVLARRPTAPY